MKDEIEETAYTSVRVYGLKTLSDFSFDVDAGTEAAQFDEISPKGGNQDYVTPPLLISSKMGPFVLKEQLISWKDFYQDQSSNHLESPVTGNSTEDKEI